MLGHQPQADEPTPVLADKGQAGEVEPVEERFAHPVDVALVRVLGAGRRLVGPTETHQIRGDAPEAGLDDDRDHLAVQVAPRRFAVHQQDRLTARAPAFVHVLDSQAVARPVTSGNLDVVRLERVAG